MRDDILSNLGRAYMDLSDPSYAFAVERLDAGMHQKLVRDLARDFAVEDQTSLGSDDVCITLFVRPTGVVESLKWYVQLSLVGNYACVSRMGDPRARFAITDAHEDATEAALLAALRAAGMELLPEAELREPTDLRPPNTSSEEKYSVYNALFTDMVPLPR